MNNHKNKKIGIITLHGYVNYGNRLQNYATISVLNSLHCSADTIIIHPHHVADNAPTGLVATITRKIRTISTMNIKQMVDRYTLIKDEKSSAEKRRIKAIKDYSDKYLNEKFFTDKKPTLDKISASYDYFITGSDQVWHPNTMHLSQDFFLRFASINQRVAYSASFGVSNIPKGSQDTMGKYLKEINKISVREHDGATIVKSLTGKKPAVLIDPTLMLTKAQWLSSATSSKSKPKQKYILTYFLGGISSENKAKIAKLAKKNNLKIVNLVDKSSKKYYIASPTEFIDYINSAQVLLTDSFHGSVFSILMERPFVVFNRISEHSTMISRIDSLLSLFNLENHMADSNWETKSIFDNDYAYVGNVLAAQRKKAIDYLADALDITKEK